MARKPRPTMVCMLGYGVGTWTDMAAAEQEWRNAQGTRMLMDSENFDEVRLVLNVVVAGSGSATLKLQYSTDNSTYNDITGASVSISSTGYKDSGWVPLPSAARATTMYFRLAGVNGDGAADPQVGMAHMQLR